MSAAATNADHNPRPFFFQHISFRVQVCIGQRARSLPARGSTENRPSGKLTINRHVFPDNNEGYQLRYRRRRGNAFDKKVATR